MKITVSPNEQGYRIKFKAPGAQPVYVTITDKELEQLKTEVMAAWWTKTKKKELRKYDVTETDLLNFTSPLNSFSSLVKHEETILCNTLQTKRKQKAQTDSRIESIRSLTNFQQGLHSETHRSKM